MKVYVVILEDRRTDVEVEVFSSPNTAKSRFFEIVEEYDYKDDEPLEKLPKGWIYNATLSSEGDCVRVEEKEVQS